MEGSNEILTTVLGQPGWATFGFIPIIQDEQPSISSLSLPNSVWEYTLSPYWDNWCFWCILGGCKAPSFSLLNPQMAVASIIFLKILMMHGLPSHYSEQATSHQPLFIPKLQYRSDHSNSFILWSVHSPASVIRVLCAYYLTCTR